MDHIGQIEVNSVGSRFCSQNANIAKCVQIPMLVRILRKKRNTWEIQIHGQTVRKEEATNRTGLKPGLACQYQSCSTRRCYYGNYRFCKIEGDCCNSQNKLLKKSFHGPLEKKNLWQL